MLRAVAGGAVVLVGLDGVPLGHLPGLSLDPSTRAPGPVVLEGEGRHFVVTIGRPSISSSGHRDIPLVAGASLVGRTGTNGRVSWTVERSGSTVWGPMRAVSISSGRDLVTAQVWRMTRGRARAVSSSVFDVRTDRVVRLAADCVAGARLGRDLLLLCSGNSDDGDGISTIEALDRSGARLALAQPPRSGAAPPAGHWEGACGAGAERAGIYLADPAGGLTLIYAVPGRAVDARLWAK